jgi:hypothetical protein
MNRKQAFEARIAALVGKPVELTVRGDRSFTFSTDDVTPDLGDKLAAFFGNLATVTADHDDECGTCAYVEVPA